MTFLAQAEPLWEWAVKVGGVVFVILVVFALAVWKGISWFAGNVAKPVVDGHLAFLKSQAEALTRHEEILKNLVRLGDAQSGLLRGIKDVQEEAVLVERACVEAIKDAHGELRLQTAELREHRKWSAEVTRDIKEVIKNHGRS